MSEYIRSQKIEKEYYAQVDGIITDEAIQQLRQGVEIGIRNVKYQTNRVQHFDWKLVRTFSSHSENKR